MAGDSRQAAPDGESTMLDDSPLVAERRFSRPRRAAEDDPLAGVTVIIPALDEQDALPRVLADLPPVGQVLVVDNGSTDATADVARQWGAHVVREPQRGYGSACLRGLAQIAESVRRGNRPPQAVVFLDADYSDHPDMLPELVQPVLTGQTDLVLGSRLLGNRERGAMPAQSVFGNRLACFLMRWLFGARYTDLGPFRAVNYRALEQLAMSDPGFGWTVEMQIKAVRQGIRIRELPVPYRCRIGCSKISGTLLGSIRAGYTILYLIAKHGLLGRRPTRPTDDGPADPRQL